MKKSYSILPASGCSMAASGVHGPALTYPRFSRAKTKPPSPITGPSANLSRSVCEWEKGVRKWYSQYAIIVIRRLVVISLFLIENAYLFNHVVFWQDIVFLSKCYDCVSINVLNFQNVTFNEFSFWNRIFCCRHLSSIVEAYVMWNVGVLKKKRLVLA